MYLITGCKGQLGTELRALLPDALAVDLPELDICDAEALNSYVRSHNVDCIINCAAYTAVDKAEDEPQLAERVNAVGPKNIAETGCSVVHISTDYVFDGMGYHPYTPDDMTRPLSVYGRTKLIGEKAILANVPNAVVIRTAWLYSPWGNNFVKTMRKLGAERKSVNVVSDQVGTPTLAADLAKAIVAILPRIGPQTRGIYHYTNEGVCSWYDFALEIMELSGLSCDVEPIPASEYPTKAVRPHYSVLDKTKIKHTFDLRIPHWKQALRRCIAAM